MVYSIMPQILTKVSAAAILATVGWSYSTSAFAVSTLPVKFEQQPVVVGKHGGKQVISVVSLPKTFNPYLASETSSTHILDQMYLGLVRINALTTEIEPSLAESWTVSADKMTYTFKIRKGAKWSDGQPVTAEDVVFTFNEIIDNASIPNMYRDSLLVDGKYPEVTRIDNMTVQFKTAKPFAPFLGGLGHPIMPEHVFEKATLPNTLGKVKFNTMWGLDTNIKEIVVSGPWKIKEFVPSESLATADLATYSTGHVTLEPNPNYYEKDEAGQSLPYLNELVFEEVKNLNESTQKFLSGETDIIALRTKNYSRFKKEVAQADATLTNLGPQTGTLFVMFNQSDAKRENGKPVVDPIKSKWFRDKAFRQALAHAMNKQRIIDEVYNGMATPQESQISTQNPYYNPDVPTYGYNLQKAAQILADAGYVKKGKQLFDAAGNPVTFKLLTNSGNAERDAICKILREDWGKLGIQVDYANIWFNKLVKQIDQIRYEAMVIGLTGSATEPHGGINTWKLDGRMHMFNMGGNAQHWKGQTTTFQPWERKILSLYEQAAQEFDTKKRKMLYDEAQILVAENLPYLFTVNKYALVAYRNTIRNIRPTVRGGSGINQILWNAERHFIQE